MGLTWAVAWGLVGRQLAPGSSIWMITGALGGSLALLGAASASGCLMLARSAGGGAPLEAHRTDSAVIGDS